VESYKYFNDNTLPPMDPQERCVRLLIMSKATYYNRLINFFVNFIIEEVVCMHESFTRSPHWLSFVKPHMSMYY